jgi:hypothetical protein
VGVRQSPEASSASSSERAVGNLNAGTGCSSRSTMSASERGTSTHTDETDGSEGSTARRCATSSPPGIGTSPCRHSKSAMPSE